MEKFKSVNNFFNGYSLMTKEEVHKAMIEYCKYQIEEMLSNPYTLIYSKDGEAYFDYDKIDEFIKNLK